MAFICPCRNNNQLVHNSKNSLLSLTLIKNSAAHVVAAGVFLSWTLEVEVYIPTPTFDVHQVAFNPGACYLSDSCHSFFVGGGRVMWVCVGREVGGGGGARPAAGRETLSCGPASVLAPFPVPGRSSLWTTSCCEGRVWKVTVSGRSVTWACSGRCTAICVRVFSSVSHL
jgi:hypothetical protein